VEGLCLCAEDEVATVLAGLQNRTEVLCHVAFINASSCFAFAQQVEIEKKWIKIDGEDPDKAGDCVTQ